MAIQLPIQHQVSSSYSVDSASTSDVADFMHHFPSLNLVSLCSEDMCAPDSLDLLTKAGLDFDRHERMGIDVEHFGELLITSGLALFDDVKWVSFHRYVARLVESA